MAGPITFLGGCKPWETLSFQCREAPHWLPIIKELLLTRQPKVILPGSYGLSPWLGEMEGHPVSGHFPSGQPFYRASSTDSELSC
jgi:hypothetical protein